MVRINLIKRLSNGDILKSFDLFRHGVLRMLFEEYGYLNEKYLTDEGNPKKDYLREVFEFDKEDIEDLYEGLAMEDNGWGFKSKNMGDFSGGFKGKDMELIFSNKNEKRLAQRTYFIVSPDKKVFSTLELENLKGLKFGDPDSILKHNAIKYWGICKSLLDETSYEKWGSFY